MSTILAGINLTNGCPHENNNETTSLLTYAQIVNKNVANISDVVNNAVKTSIATQKKDERASTAVAVFGLNESGHDCHDLIDILKAASCHVNIVNAVRIG